MLPAGELADAPNLAIDGPQPGTVALSPDHALVVRGRDLAAPLKQGAVSVKEQLSVVNRSPVPLVDADGYDNTRLFAGFADGIRGGRGK